MKREDELRAKSRRLVNLKEFLHSEKCKRVYIGIDGIGAYNHKEVDADDELFRDLLELIDDHINRCNSLANLYKQEEI